MLDGHSEDLATYVRMPSLCGTGFVKALVRAISDAGSSLPLMGIDNRTGTPWRRTTFT